MTKNITKTLVGRNRPEDDCTSARALERHYTVGEVAAMWGLSTNSVINLLRHQPGVLEFGPDEGFRTKPRKIRRVPESVLARIQRQICTGIVAAGGEPIFSARNAQRKIYRTRSVHIPEDWRARIDEAIERRNAQLDSRW